IVERNQSRHQVPAIERAQFHSRNRQLAVEEILEIAASGWRFRHRSQDAKPQDTQVFLGGVQRAVIRHVFEGGHELSAGAGAYITVKSGKSMRGRAARS